MLCGYKKLTSFSFDYSKKAKSPDASNTTCTCSFLEVDKEIPLKSAFIGKFLWFRLTKTAVLHFFISLNIRKDTQGYPGSMAGLTKLVLILRFLFYYSWKIVCNTMLYMIFQYGLEPVLIQPIY